MADPELASPLGASLQDLRRAAGLSSTAAGELLHPPRSQSAISRWETGKVVPTLEQVDALAEVYRADPAERRRLRSLAEGLQDSLVRPARVVMKRAESMQQDIARHEEAAQAVAVFQPNIVCGILQTPDYARALFATEFEATQLDAAVRSRVRRQAALDDPARSFTLIHGEGALRWHLGGPAVMADQMDRLAAEQRPNVRIGIVPWDRPVTVTALHGFDVYDESHVVVGTRTGTAFLAASDPQHRADVAEHVAHLARLDAMALFGDEARQRFEAMATKYRALS